MSRIRIEQLGITKAGTECIVNAANENLQAGGGVCGVIFQAAGHKQLQKACDDIGYCNTGSAVITPAYNLNARYIIHAVGPYYSDYEPWEAEELLASVYKSIMQHVTNHPDIKSIAIPAISCGIFRFPLEDAVNIAVDIVQRNAPISLKEVFFVVSSEHIAAEYTNNLNQYD